MIREIRSIATLVLTAVVLLRAVPITAETILSKSPMPYPPSSQVEFSKYSLEWDENSATPSVTISLTAAAKVNGGVSTSSVTVSAVSADLTVDGGRTWRTYRFLRNERDKSTWSARLEFPEWGTEAGKVAGGAAGKKETITKETKETLVLDGRSISSDDEKTDGLFKSRPTVGLESEPAETRYTSGAFAMICFSATDTMGNSTSELFNQIGPRYESEVHFTTVIADPEESLSTKEAKPRDILDVSAAWLRDKIFLRLFSAGTETGNIVTNPTLNYFAVRFVETGLQPELEQAGEGIYHYVLMNKRKIWPKKDLLGEKPFALKLDLEYLNKLSAIMNTPEKNLSGELKKLKNSIKEGKTDPSISTYTNNEVKNLGLDTQSHDKRVYWKIDSKALRTEGAGAGSFRMTFFSGSRKNPRTGAFKIDDRTAYATILFRYHRLVAGQQSLTDETAERALN